MKASTRPSTWIVVGPWQVVRREDDEDANDPDREQQSERAAGGREQQATRTSAGARLWRCPAPSARRTAISRRRDRPDASSRLATLAQAISSTQRTAPISTCSGPRIEPTRLSRYDRTSMPWLWPNSLRQRPSQRAHLAPSRDRAERPASGARRSRESGCRAWPGPACAGAARRSRRSRCVNVAGMTPITS